jgi:hypothetical protein
MISKGSGESEHGIVVGRSLRNYLSHVPMLHDLAVLVQTKYVHSRPIVIAGPLLVTVQDDVIAFGDHPFEVHTLSGKFRSHTEGSTR